MKPIEAKKYHSVAEMFPIMEGSDFDALVADVREQGLLEPIWLHTDGSIIDGRNRHRACVVADVEPRFRTYDSSGSLVGFVLSLNLHRRHLDASQKAVLALGVEAELAKEGEGRQRSAGQLYGRAHPRTKVVAILPQPKARDEAGRLVGVSPRYVQDAKQVARDTPDLLPKVRAGGMTLPEAKKEIRQREKAVRVAAIAAVEPAPLDAVGTFGVLYVDPPWRYEHAEPGRQIENQYPTMSLDEIKATDPPADDDSVLFLWATSPKLTEALEVMDAWGFEYRTCLVWVKDRIGMGYYARQRHELLLVGRRGSLPVPDPEDRPDSVITARRGAHSDKPEVVYEMIEKMYPFARRAELFARRSRDGWATWGQQAEGAA